MNFVHDVFNRSFVQYYFICMRVDHYRIRIQLTSNNSKKNIRQNLCREYPPIKICHPPQSRSISYPRSCLYSILYYGLTAHLPHDPPTPSIRAGWPTPHGIICTDSRSYMCVLTEQYIHNADIITGI